MGAKEVVLAQLIERRGYGWEVLDRLESLWAALGYSDASVYTSLSTLEQQGYVVEVDRRDSDHGGTPRRFYEATTSGITHLRDWKAQRQKSPRDREELHLQLLLARPEDIPALIERLKSIEDECRERAATIAVAWTEEPGFDDLGISPFGASLVKDALTSRNQDRLDWAKRAREALEEMLEARRAPRARRSRRHRRS